MRAAPMHSFAGIFLAAAVIVMVLAATRGASPLLMAHALFALAALPLMLGAMQHFVPVLTRSRAPGRLVAALPWSAALAGVLAVAAFAGLLPRAALLIAAALVAMSAAGVLVWIVDRLRRCLGAPHPGARWYAAALVFLLLGMLAVAGMQLDGGNYASWRRLHLHANLFGWIGLTALGTLPVLLPTARQAADPAAAARLRRDLPWAAGGVTALALGAALAQPLLAALGAASLAAVVVFLLHAWQRRFGAPWRGTAAALLMASGFLLIVLVAGVLHGFAPASRGNLMAAFACGFLLPLVSAALAQLLPVWRFPGPATPAREAFRLGLARHAAARGLIFAAAGGLQLVAGFVAAGWLEAAGLFLAAIGLIAFVAAIRRHWAQAPASL